MGLLAVQLLDEGQGRIISDLEITNVGVLRKVVKGEQASYLVGDEGFVFGGQSAVNGLMSTSTLVLDHVETYTHPSIPSL